MTTKARTKACAIKSAQVAEAKRRLDEIRSECVKPIESAVVYRRIEKLLERVEDAEDVATLKRARRKPLHYRPLEEYLADRNRQ